MADRHTAGPWIVTQGIIGDPQSANERDERGNFYWTIEPANPQYDASYLHLTSWMSEKNARLIGASPDMLEALKAARKSLANALRAACDLPDFDPAEHRVIKMIDAAISAAE